MFINLINDVYWNRDGILAFNGTFTSPLKEKTKKINNANNIIIKTQIY